MTWVVDERARRIPVRAAHPGCIDTDDPGVSGVEFSGLVTVVGESSFGVPDTVPRALLTNEAVPDRESTWRQLAHRFPESGLWPLLVSNPSERPFRSGELEPSGPALDAEQVLIKGWAGCRRVRRSDGLPLPHPQWLGLAPGSGEAGRGGVVMTRLLPTSRAFGELLLVPAERPADALAHLGWLGACNWSLNGAAIAGVLRSCEDRFGAYVVAIGFAELDVVVTRPPVTDEQCALMAREHLAFCPDNVCCTEDLDGYAEQLRGVTTWHFWWD